MSLSRAIAPIASTLIADAQVAQIGQRVDVDEDGGTRESKPHRRNEALAAGQHTGLGPMLLQVRERLVCGVGPKVIEGCRNHVANLLPRTADVAMPRERRKDDPEEN